ncbi:MAG: IS110 family transposase [Firmicutes bacterium]|nr:IS110 family transposase [Bacillota bacterium]
MEILHERCCGLDVHKKIVMACAITPEGKEIRTFGTMTEDILALAEWVKSKGCTHVAMESTGVYWKPIYNILELAGIEILVVNAQHIKAVPGRKTDVKDAEWIADLLRHGLLRGSYIPNREQRELRELVRYRKSLIEERAREVNRIQKVLEGAGIKLASVATDITGVSGKAIIEAIIDGVEDPKALAKLARGRLKEKEGELEEALRGLVGEHQRMLLATQLQHIEFLDQQIATLDERIGERMRPFERELKLLDTIPGIGRRNAEAILACTGVDMSRFPSAAHLSSWAGVAPGNNESAGKRKSGKTRQGSPLLRTTLIQAARAAARTKGTYLYAQYHRIAARRGANRACVAVAHTIIVIVYNMIKNLRPYYELGDSYFEKRRQQAIARKAIKQLEDLGYKVTLEVA